MTTQTHSSTLMTIPEVARYLRVSEKTIRRWIKEGTLTAYRLGRQWRINPKDLELLLRHSRQL